MEHEHEGGSMRFRRYALCARGYVAIYSSILLQSGPIGTPLRFFRVDPPPEREEVIY